MGGTEADRSLTMPQRMILHFSSTFPARTTEWMLACILTSWGLMLLRPETTFDNLAYLGLARIAEEDTWGWLCTAAGGLRLVALAINGLWVPPTYHLRSLTSFLSCFFWLQITLGFMASGSASTGLAVYPWLLVAEVICTYRTARDYRLARISGDH
jgi:hypothetical protein